MKKSNALNLILGMALFASAGEVLYADATSYTDMTAAKTLQKSAQSSLDSMKPTSGEMPCPQTMALQAQKTTADLAVKAHETAVKAQEDVVKAQQDAAKAQQTAEEWTNHAQTIAQAAQKIGDGSTSSATTPSGSSKLIPAVKSALPDAKSIPGVKRLMGK